MRITALEADSRSGGVRIQLDGRPFGTVGIQDVADHGLTIDREIDEAASAALAKRAESFSARAVALRMLSTRSLPAAEMMRRLVRRGHTKPAAEQAVEALKDMGLLNDAEFAKHFVRVKAQRQKFGPRRLLGDLRRMGVNERVAQQAVSDVLESDGLDANQVLREAAEKKARSLTGLDPAVAKRRLRAYLLRRGFSGGEVVSAIRLVLDS
jgi:regulatory protein